MQPIRFRINHPVGPGLGRAYDMRRLRRALVEIGYLALPGPPSGRFDDALAAALARFRRDFGLPPEPVLRPGGETERALDMALAELRTDGPAAFGALRDAFAAFAAAGLRYTPVEDGPNGAPCVFVDRRGAQARPGRLRAILARHPPTAGIAAAAVEAERKKYGGGIPCCESLSPPDCGHSPENSPANSAACGKIGQQC